MLDPHLLSLEDGPEKAAKLAQYAARHGAAFGRVEPIDAEDERTKRLNLRDEAASDRAKAVTSPKYLRDVLDLAATTS